MRGAQRARRAYGGLPRVGTGAVQPRATARDAVARLTAPRAVGAATDEVLVGHIRRVLEASSWRRVPGAWAFG